MRPTAVPSTPSINAEAVARLQYRTAVYAGPEEDVIYMPFMCVDDELLWVKVASSMGDTLGLRLLAVLPGSVPN